MTKTNDRVRTGSWRRFAMSLVFAVSVAGASLAISGCAQQQTPAQAEGKPRARTVDAPASSTARQAAAAPGDHDHTAEEGDHHHATEEGDHHHATEAGQPGVYAHSTRLSFSAEPGGIPVGKPTTWTLKITDAGSGAPVNDFETEMTKLMHLVVVKQDLSWFNHIHPEFKGDGTFVVTTTLPVAGQYKVYADYTPKGKGQEVPQYEFATQGTPSHPPAALLVPDNMQGAWMTKKITAHPEGKPEAPGGATYEVALMPMPMPLRAGQDTMLHFQIRDTKGQPIKDLQPYLGAMGHCVILSSDTNLYLHSHPMAGGAMPGMNHDTGGMKMDGDMSQMNHNAPPKSGGPDVMFHTNFPTPGLYKVWGQFRHQDRIVTAPFVVKVAASAPSTHTPSASSAAPASQDVVYTCPMHPEVRSNKPGQCPKCGMTLVKRS